MKLVALAGLLAVGMAARADYAYTAAEIRATAAGVSAIASVVVSAESKPGIGLALDAHAEYRDADGTVLRHDETQIGWAERRVWSPWSGTLTQVITAQAPLAGTPPQGAATVTTWYAVRVHGRRAGGWETGAKRTTAKVIRTV